MTQLPPPLALTREDYAAIESAVMETARGRWFLAEYAHRNRNADTTVLLEAIARLERSFGRTDGAGSESAGADVNLRRELTDMASSIRRTKTDIAHSIAEATGEVRQPTPERAFDDLVAVAEQATQSAARATGDVEDMAKALRAGAPPNAVASGLERNALDLTRAAGQHALTTDRVRSIVAVLREMEDRIRAIMGGWTDDAPAADPTQPAHPVSSTARPSQRAPIDERDVVLAASPGSRNDDLVFVDTSRWRERRTVPEPTLLQPRERAPAALPEPPSLEQAPLPVEPKPPSQRTVVDDTPQAAQARSPFDSLEAMPEISRMVVFV